jgi:small subunit ribosomal protein S14
MVAQFAAKRKKLKAIAGDLNKPAEDRFAARLKLSQLPRNSSATRIRNRCELTGRSRGYYRKLKVCRNMLRELASQGLIPGMVKSSW